MARAPPSPCPWPLPHTRARIIQGSVPLWEALAPPLLFQLAFCPGHAGRPEDSGISLEIIEKLGRSIPTFGVCMGHQCIGQVFGGKVVRAPCGVMQGKT